MIQPEYTYSARSVQHWHSSTEIHDTIIIRISTRQTGTIDNSINFSKAKTNENIRHMRSPQSYGIYTESHHKILLSDTRLHLLASTDTERLMLNSEHNNKDPATRMIQHITHMYGIAPNIYSEVFNAPSYTTCHSEITALPLLLYTTNAKLSCYLWIINNITYIYYLLLLSLLQHNFML